MIDWSRIFCRRITAVAHTAPLNGFHGCQPRGGRLSIASVCASLCATTRSRSAPLSTARYRRDSAGRVQVRDPERPQILTSSNVRIPRSYCTPDSRKLDSRVRSRSSRVPEDAFVSVSQPARMPLGRRCILPQHIFVVPALFDLPLKDSSSPLIPPDDTFVPIAPREALLATSQASRFRSSLFYTYIRVDRVPRNIWGIGYWPRCRSALLARL